MLKNLACMYTKHIQENIIHMGSILYSFLLLFNIDLSISYVRFDEKTTKKCEALGTTMGKCLKFMELFYR